MTSPKIGDFVVYTNKGYWHGWWGQIVKIDQFDYCTISWAASGESAKYAFPRDFYNIKFVKNIRLTKILYEK